LLGVTIALFVDYFLNDSKIFQRYLRPYAWYLMIATTTGSLVLSLVYSEYFGFVPCSLCWLQRIALYPQALLSVIAYRLKDQVMFPLYGLALSIFGLGVAVYHYIYQSLPSEMLAAGVLPCLTDGSSDCAAKVFEMYGFVTFPFLSAVTFAFLIIIYINLLRSNRS